LISPGKPAPNKLITLKEYQALMFLGEDNFKTPFPTDMGDWIRLLKSAETSEITRLGSAYAKRITEFKVSYSNLTTKRLQAIRSMTNKPSLRKKDVNTDELTAFLIRHEYPFHAFMKEALSFLTKEGTRLILNAIHFNDQQWQTISLDHSSKALILGLIGEKIVDEGAYKARKLQEEISWEITLASDRSHSRENEISPVIILHNPYELLLKDYILAEKIDPYDANNWPVPLFDNTFTDNPEEIAEKVTINLNRKQKKAAGRRGNKEGTTRQQSSDPNDKGAVSGGNSPEGQANK